jgi:hypothetical protein
MKLSFAVAAFLISSPVILMIAFFAWALPHMIDDYEPKDTNLPPLA